MPRSLGSPRAWAPSRGRIPVLLLLLAAAACHKGDDGAGANKPPPEVGFRIIYPTSAPLVIELPGRVAALQTAEVRPQISGVIQRRLFTEGSFVRAGQPLYQIDPSLYRAAADQAAANLASAQATAASAGVKAARYKPLAADQAVSQQDYTDAAASARAAHAAVAQQNAALNTARINLRFTTVPAPISGRIGRSLFTQGALVTSGQAGPLAVISSLDPVYVDIQQSADELVKLRRAAGSGPGADAGRATVRVKLGDGSDDGFAGTLEFSEVTVDPSTGTVTLRARIPNPGNVLLPGMFVRAEVTERDQQGVFLVPQSALARDARGAASVFVVGPDGKAQARPVVADRTQGTDWVVTQGLDDGDKLITQGIGKLKPGAPVKPVPETAPQTPRVPGPGAPARKS